MTYLDNVLWRPGHDQPATSSAAKRIAEAVSAGRCGAMFPAVGAVSQGHVTKVRRLSGPDDARFVAAALSQPRFRPWITAIDQTVDWCDSASIDYGHLFASEVLTVDNDGLFGPVFNELFTVCATRRLPDIDEYCHRRLRGWLTYLDTFLRRLHHDRDDLDGRLGFAGPIVSVCAHGAETHNGGRRVLKLGCAAGSAVAYKARPVQGESMFLDTNGSVFALVNSLVDSEGSELATLTCLARGTGGDSWLWQEWIEPAHREAILHQDDVTVTGPVIPTEQAPLFWSRAGALAAMSVAFGIGDLIEGNIIVGRRVGEVRPRHYVVDLEVFGSSVKRLSETGLIAGTGPLHHVGFENRARMCTVDPPMSFFDRDMTLFRMDRVWARESTDTVVADSDGRIGYGPYLSDFVRGAFDLWATLCRHRDELATALVGTASARVLPRDTEEYARALQRLLLDGEAPPDDFSHSEREQLLAGDVPYFYVAAPDTEQLRTLDGAAGRSSGASFVDTDDWDLGAFGLIVRDAADFAAPAGPHRADGVRIGYHEAAIEWADMDSRLIYTWDEDTVRLQVAELGAPSDLAEVASQLERIDRADATLRNAWVDGGRTDDDLAAQLAELCAEAAVWLESVVDEHGWPTAAMVGAEAAGAACRLLQHMDGSMGFRYRCLREMTAAARHGQMSFRDVAYATDAVRLADGRPQLYGTKFELRDGEFVPSALSDPEGVDARRAAVGLPSLAVYAEKIRQRFEESHTSPTTGAAP